MTAPVVGQVAVEVIAEARALAKSLKAEVEKAFRDLDFSKAIQDSIGKTKITVPVGLDPDTDTIPEKVRRTRVPKIPVELDPVLAAFQQEVKRQTDALARTVNAKIPVSADTAGLRAELGSEIAAVQRQLKATIPTEPGSQAEYALKLRAAVDEASAKVKARIKIEPDTDGNAFSKFIGGIGGLLAGIGKALPNFGGIASQISEVGSAAQRAAGSSAQLGGSLTGAFSTATGPIGLVIGLLIAAAGAVAVVGAASIAAGPAIAVLVAGLAAAAGAAAAIPAALAGAGAAIGTLALGFKGISAAFKPKVGGGAGGQDAASKARQIAAAERGVEAARRGIAAATRGVETAERNLADAEQRVQDAQKRVQRTQEAVNKARKEAKEDIEDLGRALRGAQLDEQDAALGVEDALRALNEAKLTGNLPDIQRAELAYKRAQLTLENAKDSAQDLGDEQAEASKKGVEGSDKVQSALQDQADALRAVQDAQEGVLDAQNGVLSANDALKSSYDGLLSAQDSLAESQKKIAAGAAAAAAAVVKLAPAAQKFVDAVKALKPAFESLRLDVQQRLFAGLDKTVTNLGKTWIPALRVTLGSYADTFNRFFKNLGSSLTQPKFISDLQAGADGARQGIAKIGGAVTTSLVPAFGALARAAGPFLSDLGGEIAGIVTQFSNWVLEGEKTGGLKSFFDRAAQALHDIFTTTKLVLSIIGSLFEAIIGKGSAASGKSTLDSFNDALLRVSNWLKDPKNQQKVRDFLYGIVGGLNAIKGAIGAADGFIDRLKGIRKALFGQDDNANAQNSGAQLGELFIAGLAAAILGSTVAVGQLGVALGKAMLDGAVAGTVATTQALINAAGSAFSAVVSWVKNLLGIKSPSTVFAQIAVDVVQGFIGGIGSRLGALAAAASSLKTAVTNRLADAGSWLVAHGRSAANSLGNGLRDRLSALSNTAAGLRNAVSNALSNAGSLLYNAGRNIVAGLINGIASLIGRLGSYLNSIGSFIQNNKGPIEKDRRLLVGAGQAIMGGLIAGIDSQKQALGSHLGAVSEQIATGIGADLFKTANFGVDDMAAAVSVSAAPPPNLEAFFAKGATGDPILDALKTIIKFRHSGSVQAALGSA